MQVDESKTHCYKTSVFPGIRPVAVGRSEGPRPSCPPGWSVWGPKDWAHRHVLCSGMSCVCNVCSNIVSIYPQYMSTGIYVHASVSQENWSLTLYGKILTNYIETCFWCSPNYQNTYYLLTIPYFKCLCILITKHFCIISNMQSAPYNPNVFSTLLDGLASRHQPASVRPAAKIERQGLHQWGGEFCNPGNPETMGGQANPHAAPTG